MDNISTTEEFEDDSNGWEECDDVDVQLQHVICLFCDVTFSDAVSAFIHCCSAHHFNIYQLKLLHNLDCIAYIKLVNFIRQKVS